MVLRRDDQAKRFHSRKLIILRDKSVFEYPAFPDDGLISIGCFVAGKHFVDRGVADGMGRDAPTEPIQFTHNARESLGLHRIDAAERALLAPWFFVRFAHPAAFETAVDPELHAANPNPLVALVGLDASRGNRRAHPFTRIGR